MRRSFLCCCFGLIVVCLSSATQDAAAKTFDQPRVPMTFDYPDDWQATEFPGPDGGALFIIDRANLVDDEGASCAAFAVAHFGDESWPALDDMPAFRNERLSDFKENPAAILKALDADVDTATAAIVQINGLPWLRLDYETDGWKIERQGAAIMTVRGAYELLLDCSSPLRKHLRMFDAIFESVRTITPD